MVSKRSMAKFQRVTALFEVGREVVLEEDGPDGPVLVWVSKLNPFEQEEARKDGSVGRARALLMLDDPSSSEMAVFEQALDGRSRDDLTAALVHAKENEDYVQALDDIRSLEEWQDKILVLDRGDELLADSGHEMPDDEAKVLSDLNQEYMAKVQELLKALQDARKADLDALTDAELRKAYRDAYRENAGSNGFLTEYKTSEIYYALRDCNATKGANERWDHGPCQGHRDKLLESRAEVRELPEELLAIVRDAIRDLAMTPKDAGNSGAPASSSASSGPASELADSTPSIPAAM